MKKNILLTYPSAEAIFGLFKQLNRVPRPSWHEEKAAEFLMQFAASRPGLQAIVDEHLCVVIRKPATPGYEQAPGIVLLNHMDMVCVAEEGKTFDPLNDPIESYIDNGWLKARGTSLGADNGVGLSMALAVLENDDIVHGPLECIFTTNEEDGMTGAVSLSPDCLKGRLIINLDSEDYDVVTVGSAAAYLQFSTLPFSKATPASGDICFHLRLKGGKGGHAGVDIHKGRINANKLLGEFLYQANLKYGIRLACFNGGEANNSIAANAEATVCIPASYEGSFMQDFELFATEQQVVYQDTDPDIHFTIRKASLPESVICRKASDGLLQCLHATPFGVLKMSETMENTVETSHNIGMIKTNEEDIFISNFTRSFIDAKGIEEGTRIRQLYDEAGAQTEVVMSAPGWVSDLSSELLAQTDRSFLNVLGFIPKKVAMHFALEAGYFVRKFPGCQMVSIGPKIVEPHSVTERVNIQTVEDIWKVLVHMLYELAQNKG